MRMIAPTHALAAVAAALLILPASPAAAPTDVTATNAYLQANYRLVQTAVSQIPAGEATLRRVLARVRRECPAGAAGSPQNGDSTQLSNEVIGAMVLNDYHRDMPALRAFVASVSRLRFSDRGLGRALHAYAGDVRVLAALSPPQLCSDVHAWVAGGYAALAPSTVAFDRRFMPAWVGLGELPGRLAAYESPAQRGLVARTVALESKIADAEARAVATWGDIMNLLELWP